MPRARSTWECLRSKTGFTNRWKYSPFFFGLRNFLSLLASQCLTSPLVLVASVQYIVSGDNLSLCIVIAHHIGVHVEDCHQTSALLMVAITQTDYHPVVVAVLARMEFYYGTFGKRLFGKPRTQNPQQKEVHRTKVDKKKRVESQRSTTTKSTDGVDDICFGLGGWD